MERAPRALFYVPLQQSWGVMRTTSTWVTFAASSEDMPAPLFKKNTLELTRFVLSERGFSHRGITYTFDDVVEIGRLRHRLEVRTLGVGSDFTHSIAVVFVMRSGEDVQITEQPTWTSDSKVSRVEQLEAIFDRVEAATYASRMEKYLSQLEDRRFFEYAGWHFYPEDRKIIQLATRRAYSTDSSELLRAYGFLEVRDRADGVGAKVRRFFRGPTGINTLRDTDVFFALLSRFFGLTWS